MGARACDYANVAGEKDWAEGFPCDDEYQYVAPVGKKWANEFGLYDVLGNVSEWTCSAYAEDYDGSEFVCAEDGPRRVLRGGSWFDKPRRVRSANRNWLTPVYRNGRVGFRLARTL
jgi:formylglycine-generating enzyme required for sulfatase activity